MLEDYPEQDARHGEHGSVPRLALRLSYELVMECGMKFCA